MPRKGSSQQTQYQDPTESGDRPPGEAGAPPGDGIQGVPDAWLDNPRNVQAFYDAIERARKAKSRRRPS
jgi:hypothetical protein